MLAEKLTRADSDAVQDDRELNFQLNDEFNECDDTEGELKDNGLDSEDDDLSENNGDELDE